MLFQVQAGHAAGLRVLWTLFCMVHTAHTTVQQAGQAKGLQASCCPYLSVRVAHKLINSDPHVIQCKLLRKQKMPHVQTSIRSALENTADTLCTTGQEAELCPVSG